MDGGENARVKYYDSTMKKIGEEIVDNLIREHIEKHCR